VKFAFIAAEKAGFPVAPRCEVLGVSRSGFYAWQERPPAKRTQAPPRRARLREQSRRGNCWDNAVAESFFSTLKIELVSQCAWATRVEARADLFEYLEVFYNGQRRHSSLGYLSPIAFERQHEQKRRVA
jgi:Integrase core domain